MWYAHWIEYGEEHLACFGKGSEAAWRWFIIIATDHDLYLGCKAWLEWRAKDAEMLLA